MTLEGACRLLIVAAFGGITGCATPGSKLVAEGNEALKAATVVRSFAEVRYVPTVLDEPLTLKLQPGTVAFDDGVSRRFIAGVQLPAFTRPYSIEILSPRVGTMADPGMVYPTVHVLDAQHQLIRTVPASDWKVAGSSDQSGLSATIFINDDKAGERFLVVLPMRPDTQSLVAVNQNVTGVTTLIVPVSGGALMWMIPTSGSSVISNVTATPVGDVRITLKSYSLRRVGDR